MFFLFLHENIRCGYSSMELLMSTHSVFLWRLKKNINTFWLKKVPYDERWICSTSLSNDLLTVSQRLCSDCVNYRLICSFIPCIINKDPFVRTFLVHLVIYHGEIRKNTILFWINKILWILWTKKKKILYGSASVIRPSTNQFCLSF